MRAWIVLIAVLLALCSLAGATTIEVPKNSYTKGETITINGRCETNAVELSAEMHGLLVFHETTSCAADKAYGIMHKITQLDPKGRWRLTAVDGLSTKSTDIYVNPTREGGYLLLTLLSPSETEHYRTEEFNASIRVSEDGKAVEDASVVAWGAEGSRHEFTHAGGGVYSMRQFIPVDAPLGKWEFTVTAQGGSEDSEIGGEGVFGMSIAPAQVDVEIESPQASNFTLGFEIPVKVRMRYLDGRLFKGDATLKVGGEKFRMDIGEDYSYSYNFMPNESNLGTTALEIGAEDGYGNTAHREITVIISEGIINSNTVLIAGAAGFVLLMAILFFATKSAIGRSLRKRGEMRKRSGIEGEISQLKRDYFENATISKKTYSKRLGELREELEKLEGGIC
ncbi:MAG: hypothetical protein V1676_00805 [Candidatus Diapherotrites archaeon]